MERYFDTEKCFQKKIKPKNKNKIINIIVKQYYNIILNHFLDFFNVQTFFRMIHLWFFKLQSIVHILLKQLILKPLPKNNFENQKNNCQPKKTKRLTSFQILNARMKKNFHGHFTSNITFEYKISCTKF